MAAISEEPISCWHCLRAEAKAESAPGAATNNARMGPAVWGPPIRQQPRQIHSVSALSPRRRGHNPHTLWDIPLNLWQCAGRLGNSGFRLPSAQCWQIGLLRRGGADSLGLGALRFASL
ncbi:hypothetical protein AAFF_G00388350 [Aldrovandia affinis]|uniref:Uncharacterized protein n=1 Tax=Aldrovandia affinis TaxID=143900 RepID=A0AAD7SF63_9TELE|nr:hypothetical protein AAFF_G00388350 [Aldrovandia affinis]